MQHSIMDMALMISPAIRYATGRHGKTEVVALAMAGGGSTASAKTRQQSGVTHRTQALVPRTAFAGRSSPWPCPHLLRLCPATPPTTSPVFRLRRRRLLWRSCCIEIPIDGRFHHGRWMPQGRPRPTNTPWCEVRRVLSPPRRTARPSVGMPPCLPRARVPGNSRRTSLAIPLDVAWRQGAGMRSARSLGAFLREKAPRQGRIAFLHKVLVQRFDDHV